MHLAFTTGRRLDLKTDSCVLIIAKGTLLRKIRCKTSYCKQKTSCLPRRSAFAENLRQPGKIHFFLPAPRDMGDLRDDNGFCRAKAKKNI